MPATRRVMMPSSLPFRPLAVLGWTALADTWAVRALRAHFRKPELIPLATEPCVRFERGAGTLAMAVGEVAAAAIERVESCLGLFFVAPPQLRVYAGLGSFHRFSSGSGDELAVSAGGSVSLSPRLASYPREVESVVRQELAHLLIRQHLGLRSLLLPPWFSEGLAGLAAGEDGAAGTESGEMRGETVAALRRGTGFVPQDRVSWFRRADAVSFGLSPSLFRRQAALFLGWLRRRDEAAFRRLLAGLAGGAPFATSFAQAWHATPASLWQDFLAQMPA